MSELQDLPADGPLGSAPAWAVLAKKVTFCHRTAAVNDPYVEL